MPEMPSLDRECFFIAPIGESESDIRRRSDGILKFVVARAAEELGLIAVRADQIAEPGIITRQVIDHLLNARAAIADLTGLNANVFYELAVRHTARLPTVLIAEEGEQLPFDIAQMRTIFFDHKDLSSADTCREAIVAHLRQGLAGSVDSPIGTSLDLRSLESGTAVERSVAELVDTVTDLNREIRDLGDTISSRLSDINPKALEGIVDKFKDIELFAEEREDEQLDELLEEIRPIIYHISRRTIRRDRGPRLFNEIAPRSRRGRVLREQSDRTMPEEILELDSE